MKWACGLTTHPKRRETLLPRTLASLERAGFDRPRLFVDGVCGAEADGYREQFGLEVTPRWPLVRTAANMHLALWEMFLRDPDADRYALFQDDVVFPRNLRWYIEPWFPEKGYLNLFTFNSNVLILRERFGLKDNQEPPRGWHVSHQSGRGGVGTVFCAEGIRDLFQATHLIKKQKNPVSRWRAFDGAMVTCMNERGWREFVHYPTLSYHTGIESVMDKRKPSTDYDPNHPVYIWPEHNTANFPGEDFDCLDWLSG